MESPDPDLAARSTLTREDLAALTGTSVERIGRLMDIGVLEPLPDDRHDLGDVHRVRLLGAFEAAGIPLEALAAGARTGRVDFASYHQLHGDPGLVSATTYAMLREEAGSDADALPAMFAAFGLAEPLPEARLDEHDERSLRTVLDLLAEIEDRDLALRVLRLFGETTRRSTAASLGIYEEAASRLGPDPASIPPDAYARLLTPWTRLARNLPGLAAWLTERHLTHAIDAFSVATTEQLLAADGFVPEPRAVVPGIAFIDLTGFTRLTQELGDEAAAGLSLRLGDIARTVAERHDGRLVKLLGDGALLWLPDAHRAVAATAEVMTELSSAGLPNGHAGIHHGPVIEREGDVFGRTVNMAARLSDRAPDGEIYVTAEVVAAIGGSGAVATAVGEADLQGIGLVRLFRLTPGPVSR